MQSKPAVSVLAVVGSLAGLVLSGLGAVGVRAGAGESGLTLLSPAEVQVFLVAMLALFVITLEAALLSARFPKASALVLLTAGGLLLACSVLSAASFFQGGLFLMPGACLIFFAGLVGVSRATPAPLKAARHQGG